MTALALPGAPSRRDVALAWGVWWARFVGALAYYGGIKRPVLWVWRLPRENQAVLAVTVLALSMGVYGVRGMLADPRTWAQVFGPPGWVVGVLASLWIARVARRPIVLLVPFALVLWVFSPRVALILVGVCLVAVGWTTSMRTGHGHITSRRTLTGATESTAHFAPSPGKKHCPRRTAVHEGGHAASAVSVGGHVVAARAFADGSGWCRARIPCGKNEFQTAVRMVTFYAGGEVAEHSRAGCSGDLALTKATLDQLPSHQRSVARTAGYAGARRAQASHKHVRRQVADALIRTGHYK